MIDLPWYVKSPSPWTLIIWGVLAVWGATVLLKRVNYRRLPWLFALTDSIFVLVFYVLISDLLWVVACGLRFAWFFPFFPDVWGLILAGARDVAGLVFVWLIIQGLLIQGVVRFNRLTWWTLFFYGLFLVAWFSLAPDMSFVDWNYAIKYGYPAARVVQDFLISHVLGRIFLVVAFRNLFQPGPSRPPLSAAFRLGSGAQIVDFFPWGRKKRKGSALGPVAFFIMAPFDKEPVGGCINYLQTEPVQDRRQDPGGQDPGPGTE
jgi:hypothetical protein